MLKGRRTYLIHKLFIEKYCKIQKGRRERNRKREVFTPGVKMEVCISLYTSSG